jgi:hypothetical protein
MTCGLVPEWRSVVVKGTCTPKQGSPQQEETWRSVEVLRRLVPSTLMPTTQRRAQRRLSHPHRRMHGRAATVRRPASRLTPLRVVRDATTSFDRSRSRNPDASRCDANSLAVTKCAIEWAM